MLSNCAFKFNLRRYNKKRRDPSVAARGGSAAEAAAMDASV
jgi:hypothetical protein